MTTALLLISSIILLVMFSLFLKRKVFYHFRTVEKNKLYRSGTLNSLGLLLICKLYQIDTIINLRSEKEYQQGDWYQKELLFCKKHNIRLINIPLDYDTPPNSDQINHFLEETLYHQQSRVLMHCEIGAVRTGMMVSVYLKHRFQLPIKLLMQRLPFFGHDINKPKRKQVRTFIESYKPAA